MIYALNYANKVFQKAQKLNTRSAYRWGGGRSGYRIWAR